MANRFDMAYGTDPKQRYDVYEPDSPAGSAIVLVHGGGWWQGDKKKEEALAERLAADGHVVFAVDYRLADPSSRVNLFPTQIDDVALALSTILDSDVGFDRKRVAVMGGSSGGNLAVETALRYRIPAVSWSGLIVLDEFLQRHQEVEPKQLQIDASAASAAVDQTGADDAYYKWCAITLLGTDDLATAARATAVHRTDAAARPMLLVNSLSELVPRTEPLVVAEALGRVGVLCQLLLLPGSRHAEGYLDDAIEPTLLFLRTQLAPED